MGTFLKIIASLCLGFYGLSYDTPFAQVIYYKKMTKWQKRIFTIFKPPYDPQDINARRNFFSRIAWLIVRKLCANFEENRRGPPLAIFLQSPNTFFLWGKC